MLCPNCGPRIERLPWLDRHARVTRRLGDSVVRLCSVLPLEQVAAYFRPHWGTVKALDKRALQRELEPADWSGGEILGNRPV